jgi:hypothetical protein
MQRFITSGVAGLLAGLALAPAASAGPQVSVRVEGQQGTLLARTAVTLPEGDARCEGDSAYQALDLATAGNWDRQEFAQTILGETHDFSDNDYWSFWAFRGGVYKVTTGICDERLAAGEELLAGHQVADSAFAPTIFPLWIADLPSVVRPGEPFTVTVNRAACETTFCNPGEGHAEPAAGATVTAAGATVTADAQGRATLTLAERGEVALRATQDSALPSATERTCVSDGADGFCGYVVPPPAADRTPPVTRVLGIRDGRRLRTGPRALRAAVEEAGAIAAVRMSLTRKRAGRCTAFRGDSERFARVRCGRHPQFGVGTARDVSFLLPARLGPGRYVLTVLAEDAAGNRERVKRGRNRVRFTVR